MNNELIHLFEELNILYEKYVNDLEPTIIDLINNNSKDINLIEKYLDQLLSIPTNKSYELFILLSNYYLNINKENAIFYIKEYKKLYKEWFKCQIMF